MNSLQRKLDRAAKTGRKARFTPEEITQAISLLATEDVKQRFAIGNAILQQRLGALPELIHAMGDDKPEVRRTVIYVLGKLAGELLSAEQALPTELVDALHSALHDTDPKVRANSAIALGDLKLSESASCMIDALAREESAWVRPSMILAMGSIGTADIVEFLKSYQPRDSKDRSALQKVLDRSVGSKAEWHFVRTLAEKIPVELWTVEGLENVVAEGVKEELKLPVDRVTPGRVCISTTDPYGLSKLRTFNELLIPLARVPLVPGYTETDIRAAIEQALKCDAILDRILSLHEDQHDVIRYRLEVRGEGLKHYVRKAIIGEITDLIATSDSRFLNSTSNYNIEIRIMLDHDTSEILLKPYTIPDERFSYRLRDVPASINPATAAGVVRLASKLNPNGRVLDPFCGSGTMLIERAFAAGYGELVGIDISKAAIEAARANVEASGLNNTKLIRADMRGVSHDQPFDEIITNMPFGIRTGKHGVNIKLYQDFFDLIPRLLRKQGSLTLYTQEVSLAMGLFRKSKHLRLLRVHRVASGGLRPAVFVATRK